jgi:hypothetical protein
MASSNARDDPAVVRLRIAHHEAIRGNVIHSQILAVIAGGIMITVLPDLPFDST